MTNCYYHSRKEAVSHCCHCQREFCEACTILVEGEPFCQICWDGLIAPIRNHPEPKVEYFKDIPWQRWREIGLAKAFIETAGQVVFQPSYFFSHLPTGKELGAPLFFATICILLFWFPMNILYIKLIFPAILNSAPLLEVSSPNNEVGHSSAEMQQELRQRIVSISGMEILTMPINFVLFNIFIASLLQQILISYFQGREGFIATFQIRCYAMIAQCLLFIPIIGIFLAEIGSLFVCLRGFQVVQKLSFAQSLCVALVPVMISFLALPAFL